MFIKRHVIFFFIVKNNILFKNMQMENADFLEQNNNYYITYNNNIIVTLRDEICLEIFVRIKSINIDKCLKNLVLKVTVPVTE